MMETTFNADLALEQYEKRKEENKGKKIDNSSLHAGSPMYYYCHKCSVLVDTRSEGWLGDPPAHHCDPCKVLVDLGLI